MAISVRSAKSKGRKLQNHVRDKLLELYPQLECDDIKSAIMGQSGEDVILSPAARKLIPFSFECKARKSMATLYQWFAQATGHHITASPVLILKQDRAKPLAVIDLELFLELIQR